MYWIARCRSWGVETEMLNHWHEHSDMFPHIPSQSRFSHRRRNLMLAFNLIRHSALQIPDMAQERLGVIDSLPIPVVQFHLVPEASNEWAVYGARFGKVPSKKETILGYKLHLRITLGGLILDFELAPADVTDLQVGQDILSDHTDLLVLGDKAYISSPVAAELLRSNRLRLKTLPRSNQKQQVSSRYRSLFNRVRQIIETVNGQLSEQFNIEQNHAHSFFGLCGRLYTKLTAHTLCIYINRLLGNDNYLHIKSLAFPN